MNNSKYFLCHRDREVAAFSTDGYSVLNIKVNTNELPHLPVGIRDEKGLREWILNRGIPKSRSNIKRDLGGISTFQYALSNLGVSLTDCYWFKPFSDRGYSWNGINLYINSISDTLTLDPVLTHMKGLNPDSSLKGDLKKRWVLDKGKRVLIKGNSSDSCIQSIAEVFASDIHSRQGYVPYVKYSFIMLNSHGKEEIGCRCDAFTSENIEFVPAIDFLNSLGKKSNSESYYQQFMSGCFDRNINYKLFFDYMVLTDFIISNSDRHLGNFGLLRTSDTLSYIGYAPIFDSGNSLFYNKQYVPVDKGLLGLETNSFYDTEIKMLKTITYPRLVDVSKLPSCSELFGYLTIDKTLSVERRDRLVKAYNKKIEYLAMFQNDKEKFFSLARKARKDRG